MMSFMQLGASLYVPATRADLTAIGNHVKYPGLRSVIFCTEDAIRPDDVPRALNNLEAALRRFEPTPLGALLARCLEHPRRVAWALRNPAPRSPSADPPTSFRIRCPAQQRLALQRAIGSHRWGRV